MNISNKTYKELSIPYFKETFVCIDDVMSENETPYYLIGASAIALQLLKKGIKPNRGTKDKDFAFMIPNMAAFENITVGLNKKGFHKVIAPWTFYSNSFNVAIDLLPFGEIEEQHTDNFNERYIDLHVLGFSEVLEAAVPIPIEEKIANIPTLEGMVILKLIAWSDRPEERENDLADILRIIQHYYDLEFDEIVEFHYDTIPDENFDQLIIAAEVLGRKSKLLINKSKLLSERIEGILTSNLKEVSKSEIAKDWAKKLDRAIEYTFSILEAFHKGVNSH